MSSLRIGLGIDLHRLAPGRPCRLGDVRIPSPVGPDAHSDGDVILHAVCDACLGAAGLEDLGSLFPDSDPRHAGRPSAEFCREILELLREKGLSVVSLDVVVEAERPKIAAYRPAIRARLAALFSVDEECVNVKGKTGEGLDAVGRAEAIRATAVVLLA